MTTDQARIRSLVIDTAQKAKIALTRLQFPSAPSSPRRWLIDNAATTSEVEVVVSPLPTGNAFPQRKIDDVQRSLEQWHAEDTKRPSIRLIQAPGYRSGFSF